MRGDIVTKDNPYGYTVCPTCKCGLNDLNYDFRIDHVERCKTIDRIYKGKKHGKLH